jgi:hypothetical protein
MAAVYAPRTQLTSAQEEGICDTLDAILGTVGL